MGTTGVKMKIMPSSPEANIEEIKEKIQKMLEEKQANRTKLDDEPVAFGLKAINVFFEWPEEKELEDVENSLKEIEEIQSLQVTDMRKLD